MKRILLISIALMSLLLLTVAAFAQSVSLPSTLPTDAEYAKSFVFLVQNWKALGPIGIGMVIVMIAVQLVKSDLLNNWFKELSAKAQVAFITLTGLIYGALYTIAYTKQGVDVFIVGLISSGGAVSLFNLIKLLIEKPKASQT